MAGLATAAGMAGLATVRRQRVRTGGLAQGGTGWTAMAVPAPAAAAHEPSSDLAMSVTAAEDPHRQQTHSSEAAREAAVSRSAELDGRKAEDGKRRNVGAARA